MVTESTPESTPVSASPPTPFASLPVSGSHPRPAGEDRYTISEVAALTGLTAHTLRWYERIGLMPHVDRSHTGQRRFSNRDLDWLALVGKLRLTGMPVADMVRYAHLVREGEHTFEARKELLERTRREVIARIAELQDTLAVLDCKIGFYADSAANADSAENAENTANTEIADGADNTARASDTDARRAPERV
ncbi:MerR family transcriptional regulator [Streptomyces sp. MUM 178J]|nr:MerR family transcriptional regulator [Streptomyces sp. MUM 178J]WRQ79262.1 MerR family transcriptional regulator [Streptomyces sp. MUM 178J]